jgi:GGDEF domain-containing protein
VVCPESHRLLTGESPVPVRMAVREASKSWLFPTTVSIGIASYPRHGDDNNTLIDKAESANKHAKNQGKDRVVLAD